MFKIKIKIIVVFIIFKHKRIMYSVIYYVLSILYAKKYQIDYNNEELQKIVSKCLGHHNNLR